MAQTKKTTAGKTAKNAKAKSSKGKKPEILPDFYKEFETESGASVELSLYDKEDKADGIKLVIGGAFIIYGRAIVCDDYAFVSYPSFKSGDKFVNQAFCIEKELNEQINDALTDYYFGE